MDCSTNKDAAIYSTCFCLQHYSSDRIQQGIYMGEESSPNTSGILTVPKPGTLKPFHRPGLSHTFKHLRGGRAET